MKKQKIKEALLGEIGAGILLIILNFVIVGFNFLPMHKTKTTEIKKAKNTIPKINFNFFIFNFMKIKRTIEYYLLFKIFCNSTHLSLSISLTSLSL